jgi:hypothetical protein
MALAALVEHSRVYAQLAQDRTNRAGWKVTAAMPRNDGELLVGWVPPNFVGTGGLTHKLTTESAQAASQLSVVHEEVNP